MIVEMILVVASGHRKGEGSVPGQVGIFFQVLFQPHRLFIQLRGSFLPSKSFKLRFQFTHHGVL